MTATDANAILPDAIRIPPQLAGAVAMAASSPAPPTEAITASYTNVRRTDLVFTIDRAGAGAGAGADVIDIRGRPDPPSALSRDVDTSA
jgi:2-methylisocitrate lyase-like PEP mutase family enzyme